MTPAYAGVTTAGKLDNEKPMWQYAKYIMRFIPPLLIACFLAVSCAYMGKRIDLTYRASQNGSSLDRKTSLAVIPFIDKRENTQSVGQAAVGGVVPIPLRATADVPPWATRAVTMELASAGYKIDPASEWKVGGSVLESWCSGKQRTVCVIRLEIWIHMKDNWEILKRQYRGEGSRPALLPEEDTYQLSLEEALRDALTAFRRDAELMAP